jgi:hypothetical protein
MPLDFPADLLAATAITWRMDTNHGRAESPFSGHTQTQRGQLERWAFTMTFRRYTRREAQRLQGFFLMLEGPLGLFRMPDPAALAPLGRATGLPVLSATAAAGARTLAVSGFAPNVPGQLLAGDWIQIGDQLAKVREDAASGPTGTATLSIWPKVMTSIPGGTPILTRPARGLFRFTTQLPEWEADSSERRRPYTLRLDGVQEVLTG